MLDVVQFWKESDIFEKIRSKKEVFIESRNGLEMIQNIRNYSIQAKKSAAFFCVAGGKLSEGFDFCDYMARLVMIIGVPFPNVLDFKL